jgi:hypothetical protein
VLSAQSTGTTSADLSVRVRSESAQPIAGARVHLRQAASGLSRTLTADGEGRLQFRLLPVGSYSLRVEAVGFQVREYRELALRVGSVHSLEAVLVPEGRATVEVLGETPSLVLQRAQPADILDDAALRDLPTPRRKFTELSLITPHAVTVRLPVNAGAPDSGLSFAGASPRQNSFLVDGLDHNDLGNGNQRSTFSQEAIQEFQVIAAAASAEYGRALGGTINAITKRGTNDLQGSLFYFQRPGSLEASAPGNRETGSFRQHQFGATVGGPLIPDRLFYFVAAERLDLRDRNLVNIDPLAAQLIRASGFQLQTGSLPTEETSTSLFLRLDFSQNARSQWTFSVARNLETNDNQIPWGGLVARSSGGRRETANLSLMASHQWQPSGNLIHEIRALYTSRDNRLRSLDEDHGVQVEIQGTATFGTQRLTPQDTLATYWQVVDTLTWATDRHTLKAGADLLWTHNRGESRQNFAGYYLFAALPPLGINTALEAFLAPNPYGGTGLPAAFVQAFGKAETRFRTDSQALFLQDEWQLHPRLLVRLGLRFERESIPAFEDVPDYADLVNPPATVDPFWGPTRLPDGPYSYSALFRPSLDWGGSRLLPRVSFNWQCRDDLRVFGSFGAYSGSTNLAPVFGTRMINGREVVGVLRTVPDFTMPSPWSSWASGDGLAVNRRYTTPPPGLRVLAIPGTYRLPLQRQEGLGAEWTPRPGMRVSLDLLHGRAEGLMNVRDINARVPVGGGARRPDLRYGSVYRTDDSGESRFRSASLAWHWTPDPRMAWTASYTWSRAEDNVTDWAFTLPAQNTFDPASEWGPAYQDQRQRLLFSGMFRSGSNLSPWLRHWTLAVVARIASGRPYSQLVGYDRNQDGDPAADRPEGVGRNSETTPWTRNVDLRISRTFPMGKTRTELLVDLFNLFNTVNTVEVQNNLASQTPSYGTRLQVAPMRQVQLGLRLTF